MENQTALPVVDKNVGNDVAAHRQFEWAYERITRYLGLKSVWKRKLTNQIFDYKRNNFIDQPNNDREGTGEATSGCANLVNRRCITGNRCWRRTFSAHRLEFDI